MSAISEVEAVLYYECENLEAQLLQRSRRFAEDVTEFAKDVTRVAGLNPNQFADILVLHAQLATKRAALNVARRAAAGAGDAACPS